MPTNQSFTVAKISPGQLQGPRGLQGATGFVGATGFKGATGFTGATGPMAAISANQNEFLYLGPGTTVVGSPNVTFDSANNKVTINSKINQKNFLTSDILEILSLGVTPTVIDSFLMSQFRSAKYFIQATHNENNWFQISELSIIHDGVSVVNNIEYGVNHTSSSSFMTYTVTIVGSEIRLLANSSSGTSTDLRVIKNLINI